MSEVNLSQIKEKEKNLEEARQKKQALLNQLEELRLLEAEEKALEQSILELETTLQEEKAKLDPAEIGSISFKEGEPLNPDKFNQENLRWLAGYLNEYILSSNNKITELVAESKELRTQRQSDIDSEDTDPFGLEASELESVLWEKLQENQKEKMKKFEEKVKADQDAIYSKLRRKAFLLACLLASIFAALITYGVIY